MDDGRKLNTIKTFFYAVQKLLYDKINNFTINDGNK